VDGVKSMTKNKIVTVHIYVEIKSMEIKSAAIATDNFVSCKFVFIALSRGVIY
jgi:hypothetical protein